MKRVCLMTSWEVQCGIANYSTMLAEQLVKNGNQVGILGCNPYGTPTAKELNIPVERAFDVTMQTGRRFFDFEKAYKFLENYDILHVQYESALYMREDLIPFIREANRLGKRTVVTYHSSCIWPEFPFNYIHANCTPSKALSEIYKGNMLYLPHGIPEVSMKSMPTGKLKVRSFGLHRNNDDMVKAALKQTGLDVSYEPVYGSDKWLSNKELMEQLQDSHAIVLYYPPVDALVSSSAAGFAMGAERPLVVSDTNWFAEFDLGLEKVPWDNIPKLAEALKKALTEDFDPSTVRNMRKFKGWNTIAKAHEKYLYEK